MRTRVELGFRICKTNWVFGRKVGESSVVKSEEAGWSCEEHTRISEEFIDHGRTTGGG